MNFDASEKKRTDGLTDRFTRRFLEHHGAILEKTDTGFHAVLPEALSALLELPELIHIHAGHSDPGGPEPPRDPSSGVPEYPIHYGAALLDQMVEIACREVPLLSYRLHFDYIKSQGFERLIDEQFTFSNAVGKVESSAVVRTRYMLTTFRYLAQSDEQKEGLVSLAFNLETGACIPGMADLISGANRIIDAGNPGNGYETAHVEQVLQQTEMALESVIAEETAAFQESMKRRFRRDARNLREYYGSLKQEMEKSMERPGLSKQLIADRREKIQMIPEEMARKQNDLLKKYSIKISVRPCSLMQIKTEAVKLLFRASIGKDTKTISMIYNPVTKTMDPLVCQGCGLHTYRCTFCSRRHLLCPNCAEQCPACLGVQSRS
ncbi:MAG: hypothetical protein JEZ11_00615 [Desulfobacterales bacterium]|nr:hypothetical protein [Desulfobacterales bacterium]